MATKISNATAIAACNAMVDLVDAGSSAGFVRIYTGSQPTDSDTAETGTLLVTITLQDPAFGAAADATPGGRATMAGTPSGTAVATGTAGYFRVYDSDENHLWDGDAGTSGTDMVLDSASITSGQTVTINSFTHTQPES